MQYCCQVRLHECSFPFFSFTNNNPANQLSFHVSFPTHTTQCELLKILYPRRRCHLRDAIRLTRLGRVLFLSVVVWSLPTVVAVLASYTALLILFLMLAWLRLAVRAVALLLLLTLVRAILVGLLNKVRCTWSLLRHASFHFFIFFGCASHLNVGCRQRQAADGGDTHSACAPILLTRVIFHMLPDVKRTECGGFHDKVLVVNKYLCVREVIFDEPKAAMRYPLPHCTFLNEQAASHSDDTAGGGGVIQDARRRPEHLDCKCHEMCSLLFGSRTAKCTQIHIAR